MFKQQKISIECFCTDHSLPYTYICITKYCQCQVRLCEKCSTQHEIQNQNSNFLKMENFIAKIGTEVNIINKQIEKFLNLSTKKPEQIIQESKQKFETFALSQIKVLEDSMRYLNEESVRVTSEIKDASDVLNRKISNIKIRRNELPETFCRKTLQNNLVEHFVTFYSQEGFANFRKKLDKSLQFRGIIKDFLKYAQKYGKQYEQFMKSSSSTMESQLSMKGTIKEILRSKKRTDKNGNKNKANQVASGKTNERNNNLINDNSQRQTSRQKRARTIFGKR